MPQGSFGRISEFQDFTGGYEDITWASTSTDLKRGWYMVSVNDGTIQKVVDEPGGVVQFLTATADNDNVVLLSGPYRPADGHIFTEVRMKVADDMANTQLWAGFVEEMNQGTPVIPSEFSGSTMTYNETATNSGAGIQYDSGGTTDDFRAVAFSGTVASSNADANGTRSNQTITADEFYICRTEIDPDGTARMYIAHDGEGKDGLFLIKEVIKAVTPGDLFYATAICQNATGAALEFEVDYVDAGGDRDWTV